MSLPQPTHSRLSFSSRKRWAACAVSVPLSAGLPDSTSPAAAEGTAAHAVAEYYVREAFRLAGPGDAAPVQAVPEGLDLKGKTSEAWNDELRRHGRGYCAFLRDLLGEHAATAAVAFEHRVSAPSLHPQLYGTADCLAWVAATRTLYIVDYKYGYGEVDVGTPETPNHQLEAYAVAACESAGLHPETVVLAIYQPRRHIGKPASVLELEAGVWLDGARAKIAREAAAVEAATQDPDNTPPVPGEHCRYCRAAVRCDVTTRYARAAIAAHTAPQTLLDMTPDELLAVWSMRTAFRQFAEGLEERVAQLAREGHPKLTIKQTQGRQMWIDSKQAALTLLAMGRSDLVQAVALSEAIHALPEEWREQLVKRAAPSTSIVPVDKASAPAVDAIFKKYAKNA